MINMTKRLHSLSLAFLLLLASHVCSSPCNFPAIFNLGDSNSDTGGYSASFGPAQPPYSQSLSGKPAVRYCNGRLLIDFIAESLQLPYLSAYLDSLGANFSHGASFASTSATIIDQNVSVSQGGFSPFSLGVQLKQFKQFKSRSQFIYNHGGVLGGLAFKEDYFSQALYTIDIGQNDLTAGIFANRSADEYLPDTLAEVSRVVKSLYEMGGRNFWIHNTGPLGCIPSIFTRVNLTTTTLDSAGCVNLYNQLSRQFNLKLNETVVKLRGELPLASITYVDIYSVKYLLVSEARKHGFEKPFTACCGYGGKPYNFNANVFCGTTSVVNGTEILLGKACKKPWKRISWDGVHYTEVANKWVFDRIAEGEFSNPPNSVNKACREAISN